FMEQRAPQFGTVFTDIPVLAEALGVSPEVIHVEWPSQVVSTGFPALLVPFRGLPPLKEVEINLPALKQLLGQIPMIYAFCMETADTDCQVHARGFAPLVGIPEDPATGSVAGALGAYVARYGLLPGLEDLDFQIEQGMEIRRPSRLQVKVERQNGEVGSLRVGGPVTRVLEGKMWI
ncbi:MAG: PhzF family phenazine biosynthesis protein, partial [Nitrospinaceae bacterium]